MSFATAAFLYLVVIVLLSLLDSFISSAIFSAVAIACLNYFFVEPRYSFRINYAEDLVALSAFLLTAFVVTGLVRRSRDSAAQQGERARLLDLTQDAILARDINDVITYWNRGAEQLYGWGRNEAQGKAKQQLLRPEFPVSFEDAKATLLRTGRWEGELVQIRRDGSRVIVESRWSLERDANGTPIGTLETNHDITERKRVEEELQRNLVAIDALPAFVTRYGADGRREFINETARNYHGVTTAEVESDKSWIAIHPDDLPHAERAWRISVSTGEPFEVEMRFRRADGTYRWQLNRRMAYRDASGRILRWYGVAFDIEDRKLAQAALSRNETYLAEAQQLSRTGSFGWNTATGELFWSNETYRIFGYPEGATPSIDLVIARVHPEDAAVVRRVIEQAANGGGAFDFEHRLLMPDGSVKHLHIVAHPGLNGHDRHHFVGAVMDVTAAKQAYAALGQSERRYRNLFNYMPVPLTQIDASSAVPLLEELRARGVTDLDAHFEQHPEFIWQLSDRMISEESNQHLSRLLGARTADELNGPISWIWKHRPDTLRRSMVARYRGEEFFEEETQIVRLDGSIVDVLFSTARPSTVGGKSIVGFVDITERKRAFAELEDSERRYRDLFQYMPISLTQVDAKNLVPKFKELRAQGVTDLTAYIDEHPEFLRTATDALEVEYVNEHNVRMFGARNAEDMLGPITRYWQSGQDTIRRSIEARYRGEDFFSEETRITRMDGTVIDVLYATARPGAIADKSLVGFIDITDRKRSEDALRKSEYRYRNMFQAMAASFWELDFTPTIPIIRELVKGGVKDLRRHFADNPAFVRDLMRATRVLDVNEQTVALFGGGAKEPLLGSVEPFWPEESTGIYAEAYLRAVERKPNYSAECKLRRVDGTLFDALFTVAYPPTELGSGTTMVGVIDISARKKSEAALRESEQRYQSLFQAMAVSFWELDFSGVNTLLRDLRNSGITDFRRHFAENPDIIRQVMAATRVVDVNDRTVALFGRGAKSEMLHTTEPFWPRESWADYAEAILSSVNHELRFSVDTRLRRLDGSVFDAQFTVWYSAEDKAKGLAGILDITDRKRAFVALEQSEQRYKALFHYMPIPLWRINVERLSQLLAKVRAGGVSDLNAFIDDNPAFLDEAMDTFWIEEVNRSAVELFGGGDERELLGSNKTYWRAGNQTVRNFLVARYDGKELHAEEARMTGRDGQVLEGTLTTAFPPALTHLGISINGFVDSTERNRAQTRLRQVEADFAHAARVSMLGELTASIAHEVNQPLAAISTNGEAGLRWLGRAEPDVTEARTLIKRIVADARRAADVISRIRAMATRAVPEHAAISIDEVVREALGFLRHEVQSRGVTVTHYPARSPAKVMGDRTQLQQVVVNLAVNAMQAIGQGDDGSRRIAIRTQLQDDGQIHCAVEDSGPGIDPQQFARLFESFFTTKDGGMGMGLPICRSIIEAHGGRVIADNASSLGGARFAFLLPAIH